ncbi:PBP1A family penicillin-binding protein [Piscinibacter gummiphilus]|uniref:Penicillin-binding protein 1A n=1 Tax=Piscinibacter gummiphilus TaxID=946333 RepID=A0ABZ0D469_9BURK|nr:PBP1A family penicillin-binding protein [Piscinibacter gummiphilus]WOB10032.1 PBP1A family penicillin-binding protein [Piscinibacter gummiphilus]
MSPARKTLLKRIALVAGGAIAACALVGAATLTVLYQQLPELTMLTDYQPRQPLRVFTHDGVEIGEFGTERRYYLPIAHTPRLVQDAVLAIEDAGFREHGGVSVKGTLRAAVKNLWRASRSQGGSTITQQVARTFYLSKKKSYARKLREALLAVKIEQHLSKDQILELYLNQIYMGQRAYGFEAASQSYFGKPLTQLTVAESAMLAGVPQNPRYANPATNFERARKRQVQVLARMLETGAITQAQHDKALAEKVQVHKGGEDYAVRAEYVAEMVRQTVYAQYGEASYTMGLKVTTTLRAADQQAAWQALRRGVLDYDRRQPYRGPEDEEDLPDGVAADDPAVAEALSDHRDDDDLRVALVSEASPRLVVATLASGEVVRLQGEGLRMAQPALSPRANDDLRIRRGSVIRVMQVGKRWSIAQWPEVQGALVAMAPQTGHVRALVGGFDFGRAQFNHATQAWRQPGSSFKPFLYSAALEHGVMPSTQVNDAPLPADPNSTAPAWDPKNSDDQYDGPITLREALARSKNLVTIRLVQLLGPDVARTWASRFGFEASKHPSDLTLALGSGATTPLQLAGAYSVLANGGFPVQPVVIEKIADAQGKTLFEAPPAPLDEDKRAIPARNAWLTGSLLQEVTRSGTAARAQAQLQRTDLYGKTGTTNEAVDAWFAGYQPTVVTVVWMGHDTPRSLGSRESGGGLALPVWINFMRQALQGVPVQEPAAPEGLVQHDGEWVYSEWADGGQRQSIGFDETSVLPALPTGGTPSRARNGDLIDLEPPEAKLNRP